MERSKASKMVWGDSHLTECGERDRGEGAGERGTEVGNRYGTEYNESWLVLRGWPPLEHS